MKAKAKIQRLLAIIRKNKTNPYAPDVEANLAPLIKHLLKKKKQKREPPKF